MAVDVVKILDDLGITYAQGGANNVVTKCFNPHHEDKRPSMYIHKKTGVCHCFSCNYAGHILQIVNDHYKFKNKFELVKYIQQFNFGGTTEQEVTNTLLQTFRARTSTGQINPVDITDVPAHTGITEHPYLMKRGFTSEELTYWDMGKCINFPYTDWIYIPIVFNGVLRSYFLRSHVDKTKLYGPYARKDILFGFDTANDFSKPIYICEGIFDMIYLRRLQVQAVALLSNHISEEQRKLLKKYKSINVVPDIDSNLRGMQAIYDILPAVHTVPIFVLELPNDKKDPAECTLEEIVHADFHKVSIMNYIHRERYLRFLQTIPKKKICVGDYV